MRRRIAILKATSHAASAYRRCTDCLSFQSILLSLCATFHRRPRVEAGRSPAYLPPRILAHYMPWYEAKPYSPHWGWHWTMGAFDPDGKRRGKPAIASHYRPLIGPYDSGDPDVIEYHALLMKLAGIDGVILDWYGTADYLRLRQHPSPRVGFCRTKQPRPASSSPSATKIRPSPSSSRRTAQAERAGRARPARDRLAAQELVRQALVPEARQSAGPTLIRTRRPDRRRVEARAGAARQTRRFISANTPGGVPPRARSTGRFPRSA